MPKYIATIKKGNETYHYERRYKYLKEFKNNRADNRYLGKEKYKKGDKYVLINDKAIKEGSLHTYLFSFKGQVEGLAEILSDELNLSSKNIQKVWKFIHKQTEKTFNEVISFKQGGRSILAPYVCVIKSRYYYYMYINRGTGYVESINVTAKYEKQDKAIFFHNKIQGRKTYDYDGTCLYKIILRPAMQILKGRITGRCSLVLSDKMYEIIHDVNLSCKIIRRIVMSILVADRMIQNLEKIISNDIAGVSMGYTETELGKNLQRLESILNVCMKTNLTFLGWGMKKTKDAIIENPLPDSTLNDEDVFADMPKGLSPEEEIDWLFDK